MRLFSYLQCNSINRPHPRRLDGRWRGHIEMPVDRMCNAYTRAVNIIVYLINILQQ